MFEFIGLLRLCSCKFGVIGILVNWVSYISFGDRCAMLVWVDVRRVGQTGIFLLGFRRGPYAHDFCELAFGRVSQALKKPRLAPGLNFAVSALIFCIVSQRRSDTANWGAGTCLWWEHDALPEWDGIAVEQRGAAAPFPAGQGAPPAICSMKPSCADRPAGCSCVKKRETPIPFSNSQKMRLYPHSNPITPRVTWAQYLLRHECLCAKRDKKFAFVFVIFALRLRRQLFEKFANFSRIGNRESVSDDRYTPAR